MESGDGFSSGSYDKTKVLDVKPLRCLAPLFPSPPTFASQSSSSYPSPSPSPFVSARPFGTLPTGFTQFYPFYHSLDSQQQNPETSKEQKNDAGPSSKKLKSQSEEDVVQVDSESEESRELESGKRGDVSSFKSPSPVNNTSNVGEGTSNGSKKSHKRIRRRDEIKLSAPPDGDSETVGGIRIKFDALRRRISQLEDGKGTGASASKRADLKAGSILMNKGIRTNTRRRTGSVPGIEIGDIFFFRIEMCLVGLHAPSMAGIDYMAVNYDQEEETVAVSVVSSGGYEDEVDDKDVLIYSGQGGASKRDGKEVGDQKLERGNLALERSLHRGNKVRVIRGMRDPLNPTGKVYFYDGLYKIHESWTEKGKSGCKVFKYKFIRIPGQPEAFAIWKSILQWRDNITNRPGIILPDLTSGAEKLPVSLVNDIDDDKGPAHFTYSPTVTYSKLTKSLKPPVACSCRGSCVPGDLNCSCVVRNGAELPHTNGVLVIRKHLIHECGPACNCYPNCRNQVSQTGLKVRLEVFKTNDRGWGLRSWDAIRAGTFICEYAGEVIDRVKVGDDREEEGDDDYVFDSTTDIDNSFEWNYTPELLDEKRHNDANGEGRPSLSLVISAKNTGNVARFMNHSCSPNVFWQPVLYDHDDDSFPHIMFYAMKHIPPMTELTYDYGLCGSRSRNVLRRKKCLCGSLKCREYFR